MAKNSSIEWTHHTFNPWWGCTKVSPACDHCYAEQWAKRMGHQIWGGKASRRFFTDKHWKDPLVWNEEAQRRGIRERVFCASMADVFERRAELNEPRERLWKLIEATPSLDWLLLTKRPQNIQGAVPWTNNWPLNVWLGTTVENQKYAAERLPHLLKHPASVRFLSSEPLLGPLDLQPWVNSPGLHPISWVIAGGESGGHARPMHPDWVSGLLNQCRQHGVPFHFKQWGNWVPANSPGARQPGQLIDFVGAKPVQMSRVPKKEAGRILEGATWDGVPSVDPSKMTLPSPYEGREQAWVEHKLLDTLPPTQKQQSSVVLSPESTLSVADISYRDEREAIVNHAVNSSLEAAIALHEIFTYQNGIIWRENHPSFAAYCRAKWQYGKSHTYRLQECGDFLSKLNESPIGETVPLNENQVRPLLALPKELRLQCWSELITQNGKNPLTGAIVAKATKAFATEKKIVLRKKRSSRVSLRAAHRAWDQLNDFASSLSLGKKETHFRMKFLLGEMRGILARCETVIRPAG